MVDIQSPTAENRRENRREKERKEEEERKKPQRNGLPYWTAIKKKATAAAEYNGLPTGRP